MARTLIVAVCTAIQLFLECTRRAADKPEVKTGRVPPRAKSGSAIDDGEIRGATHRALQEAIDPRGRLGWRHGADRPGALMCCATPLVLRSNVRVAGVPGSKHLAVFAMRAKHAGQHAARRTDRGWHLSWQRREGHTRARRIGFSDLKEEIRAQ